MPEGSFERTMAVNAFGTLHAIRASLPHMRRTGQGRIISMLSRAAELPAFEGVAYGASKAAQGSQGATCRICSLPTRCTRRRADSRTLPVGGPNGRVFLKLDEYPMFRHDKQASAAPGHGLRRAIPPYEKCTLDEAK